MEELECLRRRMAEERPVAWEDFPDLPLYMDQVLAYMPRQLIDLGETEHLTSAMVNNYIKDGMLPRANGKKYSQEHLAYLTAICALKQVVSVKEAHTLIQEGERLGWQAEEEASAAEDSPRSHSIRRVYDYFCGELDAAMSQTMETLPQQAERDDLPKLALALALRSYADQLACRRILDVLRPETETQKAEKRAKKQKKVKPVPEETALDQ